LIFGGFFVSVVAMKISRLQERNCGLLVIDFQEKLVPRVQNGNSVVASAVQLIQFFRLIDAPIVITEQYPKGLGPSIGEIRKALSGLEIPYTPKTTFSACGAEDLKREVEKQKKSQWVVSGIEAHVCVQQTVFDLLELGCEIFLPADAVGSQRLEDREFALARMKSLGVTISTSESLIFEVLRDSQHPLFKQTSAMLKDRQT
jgi:nicotinamidase-related amidase